jgi:hypothetical protein
MCTMRLIKPIDIYNEAQRLRFNGDLDEYRLYLQKYKELVRYQTT